MTTSGSTDFTLTQQQIIRGALRLVHSGRLPEGVTKELVEEYAEEALNMLIRQWSVEGVGLWKNKEVIVPLQYGTSQYLLGPTGGHASYDMVITELSADASEADVLISVDSSTGISDGGYIGIGLDDNTIQWTTVSGDPSGTDITISAALTDDASDGNPVYFYTTKTVRPIMISEGRLADQSDSETPLTILTRNEYMAISNKSSSGPANSIYYDHTLSNGKLLVWPTAEVNYRYLKLSVRIPFDDFDDSDNTADLPVECLRTLKWNLADEIMDEYAPQKDEDGIWERRRKRVSQKAMETKYFIQSSYGEDESFFFEVG